MKPRARFAFLALIPLGCATGENSTPAGYDVGLGAAGTAGDSAGGTDAASSGSATVAGTGSVIPTAGTSSTSGTGGTGVGGSGETAGTFSTSGTFSSAGTFTTGGAGGSSAGTSAGGSNGGNGAAGKSTGGTSSAGTSAGGTPTAGTGGTGSVGPYCDAQPKSPLPYTVNDGFISSLWEGDYAAISQPAVQPDACAARTAGAVGTCSVWRFTPNAVTPAWAGAAWSKVFDAKFTHPPVCIADGASKVTFQARGAAGGEVVTFSAAGAAELPFTLTNAWKEYSIPLAGITYNTAADGVDSGFFWKIAPPTPGGGAVTFFVDDIQFVK